MIDTHAVERPPERCADCDEQRKRAERAEELADKYKWQVIDTCKRAEKAEARIAEAQRAYSICKTALHTSEDRTQQAEARIADLEAALERRGEAVFGQEGD
jgi:chromosome segregation ATPase